MTELLPAASAAPSPDPAGSPAPPRPAPGAVPLRVMCFNLRYGTADDGDNRWECRKDLIPRAIRSFDPDLLGVQEALRFQADELRAALPDYGFVGAGRDDGRDAGEFCAIFFRRSRFEQLDAGHFWLSESPDRPGSKGWDADLPRVVSWVRLRDLLDERDAAAFSPSPGTPGEGRGEGLSSPVRRERPSPLPSPGVPGEGGSVLFMNTHWDYAGKRARAESARLTRRMIRTLQPKGPAILVGDFNGTEDDEPYARLLHGGGDDSDPAPVLLDSYRQCHPQRLAAEATFHGFGGGADGSRIDWILHADDLLTTQAGIDRHSEAGRFPSDHFPVTAVLVRRQ